MLINRRDLQYILTVMDKFNLSEPWDGVNIDHKEQAGGYELTITFGHILNDVVCRVTVPITGEMFE